MGAAIVTTVGSYCAWLCSRVDAKFEYFGGGGKWASLHLIGRHYSHRWRPALWLVALWQGTRDWSYALNDPLNPSWNWFCPVVAHMEDDGTHD